MPAPAGWPLRLWTIYVTSAADTADHIADLLTPDDYRDRWLESIFVGAATSGYQIGFQAQGNQFFTVDLSRFAAGDPKVDIDVFIKGKITAKAILTDKNGAGKTNLPIILGYRPDPSQGL